MMIKNTNIDKITTYSYGTNIFKICENEMLLKKIKKNKTNLSIKMEKKDEWKFTRNNK